MKTLIPLLSLLCGSFAVHNCTHEDQEIENQQDEIRAAAEYYPASYLGRQDSAKSENFELVPDPPVKDTHDWRTKP